MTFVRQHRFGLTIAAALVVLALIVTAVLVISAVQHSIEQDALDRCNARLIVSGLDPYAAAARCAGMDPKDLYVTE
jgi:hypothetical protein